MMTTFPLTRSEWAKRSASGMMLMVVLLRLEVGKAARIYVRTRQPTNIEVAVNPTCVPESPYSI